MKLRNKKTGEIRDIANILIDNLFIVSSLAELNDEWEDYDEPKYYYLYGNCVMSDEDSGDVKAENLKSVGNYFETKEEAEKAVKKLKAYKRLKDKGFKFGGWKRDKRYWGDYTIEAQDYTTCDDKDLDLLFGGEE